MLALTGVGLTATQRIGELNGILPAGRAGPSDVGECDWFLLWRAQRPLDNRRFSVHQVLVHRRRHSDP